VFLGFIIAGITLILIARTCWYLLHSVTNVPYADQWFMLQEIWDAREGRSGWTYLWAPYWGHRLPLPRLLFLLSVTYLRYSTLPFTLISLTAQIAVVLVMLRLVRLLFRDSVWAFWASAVAVVHLLLSSLQALGIVSTSCLTIGLGVWPILMVEAWLSRAHFRTSCLSWRP
jgi:hypothetical protein